MILAPYVGHSIDEVTMMVVTLGAVKIRHTQKDVLQWPRKGRQPRQTDP